MGKSERRSGHGYERKIARWLRNLGVDAQRNVSETQTGNTGDVLAELRSWSPEGGKASGPGVNLVVQAKFRKTPSPWKGQEEADEAMTSPSDIAVGFCRRKGDQTLVTMRPETFGTMLRIVQMYLADAGKDTYLTIRNRVADMEDCP